jgi:hypothetical protein
MAPARRGAKVKEESPDRDSDSALFQFETHTFRSHRFALLHCLPGWVPQQQRCSLRSCLGFVPGRKCCLGLQCGSLSVRFDAKAPDEYNDDMVPETPSKPEHEAKRRGSVLAKIKGEAGDDADSAKSDLDGGDDAPPPGGGKKRVARRGKAGADVAASSSGKKSKGPSKSSRCIKCLLTAKDQGNLQI